MSTRSKPLEPLDNIPTKQKRNREVTFLLNRTGSGGRIKKIPSRGLWMSDRLRTRRKIEHVVDIDEIMKTNANSNTSNLKISGNNNNENCATFTTKVNVNTIANTNYYIEIDASNNNKNMTDTTFEVNIETSKGNNENNCNENMDFNSI